MNLLPAIASGTPTLNTIHNVDALVLLRALPDASVDMVLCDPPYATTAIEWDKPLDWISIWQELKRITKRGAALVFTASQPFTTDLINSNRAWFRYEWIWVKSTATGFLDASRKPLKKHENVIVFGGISPIYHPILTAGKPYRNKVKGQNKVGYIEDKSLIRASYDSDGLRYPTSIIRVQDDHQRNKIHPTQKPVDLFEYLIRTYTCTGDTVLDFCMGSGTTAVAARNTGRAFIGCDTHLPYVEMARKRLIETDPFMDKPLANGLTQKSLFAEVGV